MTVATRVRVVERKCPACRSRYVARSDDAADVCGDCATTGRPVDPFPAKVASAVARASRALGRTRVVACDDCGGTMLDVVEQGRHGETFARVGERLERVNCVGRRL